MMFKIHVLTLLEDGDIALVLWKNVVFGSAPSRLPGIASGFTFSDGVRMSGSLA